MRDDSNDTYIQGMKTRRAVLGEAHVDRAEASKTDFDAPFQQLIVEAAWGHVWSGAGLTPRERSLITLALLAGLTVPPLDYLVMPFRHWSISAMDAPRHIAR